MKALTAKSKSCSSCTVLPWPPSRRRLPPERHPAALPASSGKATFSFEPDPDRNFNRGSTDYFVNGRKDDIGAFESPKFLGLPLGEVAKVGDTWFDVAVNTDAGGMSNGDGLNYQTLTKDIVGFKVNVAEPVPSSGSVAYPCSPASSKSPSLLRSTSSVTVVPAASAAGVSVAVTVTVCVPVVSVAGAFKVTVGAAVSMTISRLALIEPESPGAARVSVA